MRHPSVTAAMELGPLIREHRDTTEAARKLAPAIVDRLIDTRLGRMAVASGLGGLAVPPTDALEVYEALSAAEASVGWIVWNNSLPCFFGRFLDAATRAEIFGDPRSLYACSTRPTAKGLLDGEHYRVTGRWSLVSGCELAQWLAFTYVVHDAGGPRMIAPDVPEVRIAFIPRDELRILDTWHVGGLRGTGSHDVVAEDVRVPRRRTLSPADASTLDEPIGRVPIICAMAAGFAAQTLGLAQAALAFLGGLGSKVSVDGGPGLRDRAHAQDLIARQTAAVEAARDYLHKRVAILWDNAERSVAVPLTDIAATWAAAHHAVDVAKSTVESVYAAAGTTAVYTSCPLERAHRDLHAMLRHIVCQPLWVEDAGRVTFGLTPRHPLFAI